MKTTYAKTPWKICYDGQIDSSDGQFICSFRWESFNEFEKRGQDAAFIVRAVNAHEELVNALTWARDTLTFIDADLKSGRQVTITNLSDILAAAEQALAKARGNDA